MKIAFIITSLANRGPIIMVRSLIEHLISNGYLCEAYYFDPLHDLNFPCPVKQIKFTEKIDFAAYDILHSHLFRPDLYCAYHNKAIRQSGARRITTIHTAIYEDLQYTYGRLISSLIIPIWKFAWRKMDHAVVLTQAAKEYYKNCRIKSLSIIANGRDLPENENDIQEEDKRLIMYLKQDHILLGSVCAMDKRKGLEQLLQLLVINKKYAVCVIGDGAEKFELEAMAKDYGVTDRFKVLGFRMDGYRYMKHFDIFLLTSRSEGMPLAFLEAIASKIPVVSASIPSITGDFNEEEVSYFELDQVETLNFACQKVLNNAPYFTQNAYLKYKTQYTTNQMGINYRRLYSSLINIP